MATLSVILREKIGGLGAEADVIDVKRGYAQNFLIPRGKAFEATKGNLRQLESLKEARARREGQELADAERLSNRLNKQRLKLELNVGQDGKAFGSITAKDVVDALVAADRKLEIDRKILNFPKAIKTTGDFDIPVKLHPDVQTILKLNVRAAATPESEVESGSEDSE